MSAHGLAAGPPAAGPAAGAGWPALLRPDDLVVAGQGVGEPTPLLEQLFAADLPGPLEVFVGLSHSRALTGSLPPGVSLASFGAMGPLGRRGPGDGPAVLPCHFLDVPRALRHRGGDRLVVLVQVSPPGPDGHHHLSAAVDHSWDLLADARVVVAEVNDRLPTTVGPPVPPSAVTATVPSSRPLPVLPSVEPTDVHHRIAENAVAFVPDGAALQLGVGALASVVGGRLATGRGLRVRSTLVGDWLLALAHAGALDPGDGAVVISEAAGSPELYEHVAAGGARMVPVAEVNRAAAASERLVALNSALEVDLTGQVNAEETGAGYVGGIGGQPDFLRAAQRSPDGCAVVMLPATAERGRRSRLVHTLHHGTVTTPRSGVDVVVTEYGAADLRGRSLPERAEALAAIAAPQHRDALRDRAAITEGDR